MNVARSTFKRKGYWLTALAAIVLLAASPGTAQAQLTDVEIEIDVPRAVDEGGSATIDVTATAMVPGAATSVERTVVVVLELNPDGGTAELSQPSQVDDAAIVSTRAVRLVFPENPGSTARSRTARATAIVQTNDDGDAEDEDVAFRDVEMVQVGAVDQTTIGNNPDVVLTWTRQEFEISDDETQTYVLSLDRDAHPSTAPPQEDGTITVNIEAKPAHYQDGQTFTLQLSENGGRAQRDYTATGQDSARGVVAIGTANPNGTDDAVDVDSKRPIVITTPENDGNRAMDMLTLEVHSGAAGRDAMEASLDIEVLDIHQLPTADAITAVAKDEGGNEVTQIMEGGDPVYLTITLDRGQGASDRITEEALEVDLRAANASQVADYSLSESRIPFEERPSGKQSNDIDLDIELSALSDEDVGMEYLTLNLEVSGDSETGTETSTGTFTIAIVDNTAKKVEPKAEADAYPMIRAALGKDPQTTVMNPGESGTIMTSDLFTVMDGYTASYGVSVEGGAASVAASTDSVTVTANAIGESKVTVTARARMAASSFLPEQTVSDMASITFAVMVEAAAMPEPVPALPLLGQLLLGLGLLGGGMRHMYRRRQG